MNDELYLRNIIGKGLWLTRMMDQASWGLMELIQEMGPDLRGIEIGVNFGYNAYMLLENCPNLVELVGIDPYCTYIDWDKPVLQHQQDQAWDVFSTNLPLLGDKFKLIKKKSWDAAAELPDDHYDFVFIDGDHSIKAVLSDLDNYVPKVKKGGMIAGHDIGLSGVNMAINAWCRRQGVDTNKVHLVENQAWYWMKE